MDIEQLRQLICVARHRNITRAGQELGISQPALSRSIQRLEEEFGRPLLERTTRDVKLTDAGELLRERSEKVLALLKDTKAEITDDGRTGRIRVGAIPTIAPYYLPGVLASFSAEFPEAVLLVQEDTTEALLAGLNRGEIDLAILALPITAQHLDTQSLFEEELLLVMPQGHALGELDSIDLADIEPYPFVVLGEAHCLSESIFSFCRSKKFQPLVVERTNQLTTVQELVALGHGVSLIPAMAQQLDQNERRLYRSLSSPQPMRTIAVAWNPYRFESRLQKEFRRHLSDSTP